MRIKVQEIRLNLHEHDDDDDDDVMIHVTFIFVTSPTVELTFLDNGPGGGGTCKR